MSARSRVAALVAGAIFGAGLALGGMTDPAKVRAFLDLAGDWDPSLALVMAGAIGVHLTLSRLVLRRAAPLYAPRFDLPARTAIDRRLVFGAAIFGVGWALAGVCPGPAIASLATGGLAPWAFTLAMIAGSQVDRLTAPHAAPAAATAS